MGQSVENTLACYQRENVGEGGGSVISRARYSARRTRSVQSRLEVCTVRAASTAACRRSFGCNTATKTLSGIVDGEQGTVSGKSSGYYVLLERE